MLLQIFLVINFYSFAQKYYTLNENILYNVNIGFLKVGEAKVITDSIIGNTNNKNTIKITLNGYSTGAIGFFAHIENKYESYIDTSTYLPVKFSRNQHENNFKLFEINDFDHKSGTATSTRLNYHTSTYDVKIHTIAGVVHDMISGYFKIRNTDISKLKKNDTISVALFFEEKSYTVKFKYLERDRIRTKIGKFRAFVFSPILPENTILSKREDPVKIWISDDQKRIPLNISMHTKYGKFEVEIKKYNIGTPKD